MSALDPLADVFRRVNLFCFVPRGDILDLKFDPIGMGSGRAQCSYIKSVNGKSIVENKSVTGFTNTEEAAVGLTDIVPFLVEDMLTNNGANYSKGEDWNPYVLTDGLIVTGQNPASSEPAAQALLDALGVS